MKKPIALDSTVFDLGQIVGELPTTCAWSKNQLVKVPDFGTIFMGLDKVTNPKFRAEMEDASVADGPVFVAPEDWQWCHIAKALGVFSSTTQARKNGWGGVPEAGFNFRSCRINRVKGQLLVVRITDDSPWAQETDDENDEV